MTPPRVLVGAILQAHNLDLLEPWAAGLRAQETSLLWDLLLAVDLSSVEPTTRLYDWARAKPFGPQHRIRMRSPASAGEALDVIWGKFRDWASYSLLLSLELDVRIPTNAMQSLYDADVPWAYGPGPEGGPAAPLVLGLLRRELLHGEHGFCQPVCVPDARWERIRIPTDGGVRPWQLTR